MTGIMNGPSKTINASMLPVALRPPAMPDSNSTVMIDLTAEEDIRMKRPTAVDALFPASLLGSVVRPGNVVFTQSNNNAYFLYTPPIRSTVLKPGAELEASGTGSLPALALGTSMATGTSYHSLPSLVSVNNRHPGLLQVLNMRPPPPLQSAPLRPTLQQSQPLPILAATSAPRQVAVSMDFRLRRRLA